VYRASDGNKCAIGCFIPDDIYHPEMENQGLYTLLNKWSGLSFYMPLYADGLDGLQRVHDGLAISQSTLGLDPRPVCINWIRENCVDAAASQSEVDNAIAD
jgi:hypothetical protein